MRSEGSVTHWITELKEGDHAAAQQELWNRYFARLLALARAKLRSLPRCVEDEEDVALSALDSFFRRARSGRFPELRDRTQLWPLLVKITASKSVNQLKRHRAKKRLGPMAESEDLEQIIGREPTPELAAEVAEQCDKLLCALDSDSLRSVARMKLEGYTNAEIAGKLDVTERTVGRKLRHIRRLWSEDGQP